MEDDPGLTAPELWVNRTLEHMEDAHTYGCDVSALCVKRKRHVDLNEPGTERDSARPVERHMCRQVNFLISRVTW